MVKMYFRHSIAVFALTCFLLSTSGLSLVEHYCSHSHKSLFFLFAQNPNCEHDHPSDSPKNCNHTPDETAEHQSCCAQEGTENCCKNITKIFKLIADYFSSSNDTDTDCPVFCVEHAICVEKSALSALATADICGFRDNVGPPEQLLIKRTSEFLL